MPNILENISLKPYNTFGLDVNADYFVEVNHLSEIQEILHKKDPRFENMLILGGGSNLLLTQNFHGLVLKNNLKGIEVLEETDELVLIKAGAGENWHQFVLTCVKAGFGGIENLSLIPGTVGAAPMQNIGAYGVEIKDVFFSLEALNLETLEKEIFDNHTCKFGYRESIFKHEAKGKYMITSVVFRLQKFPKLHLEYGAIKDTLKEMGVENPGIKEVSDAVIQIRQSKLPDPAEIGNSGSFFKNPEIYLDHFEKLKSEFPGIPSYPIDEKTVKVPAGWLIEQAGWKGKKINNIGVHKKQALVLVNYGGGNGNEIKELSQNIQADIFEKFGINLHAEVNII